MQEKSATGTPTATRNKGEVQNAQHLAGGTSSAISFGSNQISAHKLETKEKKFFSLNSLNKRYSHV